MQQRDMLSKYTTLYDKAGSMLPKNIPKINIVWAINKCFGYNRDHMDNTLGLYIYANGARNHGWFMSPWVHIWNNEI